jgi:hypothetical protein
MSLKLSNMAVLVLGGLRCLRLFEMVVDPLFSGLREPSTSLGQPSGLPALGPSRLCAFCANMERSWGKAVESLWHS